MVRHLTRFTILLLGIGIGIGPAKASQQAAVLEEPRDEPEPPSLEWWAVDDSTKVLPAMDLGPPRTHESSTPVTLSGAGGETVAFQLVVAGSRPVERMSVNPTELTPERGGPGIAADAIDVFLETFIGCPLGNPTLSTSAPERCPDPLVPLWVDGQGTREIAHPIEIPEGQRRVLWIDVAIPRGLAAGRYHGSLELDLDGETSSSIGITLDRHDFDLPARPSLKAWVPLYAGPFAERENVLLLSTRESVDLAHRYFKMAHEHRFVSQGIEYEPDLVWDESTGALLSADWTLYDLYHGPVLDGSLFEDAEPPTVWKVGGFRWWGAWSGLRPNFGASMLDDSLNAAHRRAITEYARLARRHFEDRGWSKPELFMYMAHEPDLERYPELGKLIAAYGRSVHDAKAGILHMVTMAPHDDSSTIGAIDIWAVRASDYLPAEMKSRQSLGEQAWFVQDREPYLGGPALNDEGLGLRSWGWIAWRYDVDGVSLRTGNNWNRDPYRDAATGNAGLPGYGVLFYPGAMLPTIGFPAVRGPVSSVRMKTLRRGLLDHDYFALLRSLGGDPDPVVEKIVPYALGEAGEHSGSGAEATARGARAFGHGAWSHEASEWDRARDTIAHEIERRKVSEP